MKKLALTNLMLLMAIKSVSACSYATDYNAPVSVFAGREIYYWTMFIGSFVFLVPIIVLYYVRGQRGLWTIVTSISLLVLFFPALFTASFLSMCSDSYSAAVIIAEFFFMSLMFTIQLSSWIGERKTAIKLR